MFPLGLLGLHMSLDPVTAAGLNGTVLTLLSDIELTFYGVPAQGFARNRKMTKDEGGTHETD